MKDNILFDIGHWAGWVFSTFVIYATLAFINPSLDFRYYVYILIPLVIVDIIKHKVKLQ